MNTTTTTKDSAKKAVELLESGQYKEGADMALRVVGGTMSATLSDTKNAPWDDGTAYRPHWKVQLKNDGKSYTFDFFDSIHNGKTRPSPTPTAYDILACLTWYEVGTFENFCNEFGYQKGQARSTWKAVVREYENLCRLFTEEQRELLSNIR